jgi:hypothetical protein
MLVEDRAGLVLFVPLKLAEAAPASERDLILAVLDRAAEDDDYIAQLTYAGDETLAEYPLSPEAKAALLSGDLRWIESRVGELDERLSTWLWCRLGQEIW